MKTFRASSSLARACARFGFAAGIAGATGIVDAAQLTGANAQVIELPPVLVESTTRPLEWRYMRVGQLEVLSVCDDDVTRRFVQRCLRLDELLAEILPARFQQQYSSTEKLILFSEDIVLARSPEIIQLMLQRDGYERPPPPTYRWENLNLPPPKVDFLSNLRLVDIDSAIVFTATRNSPRNPMAFSYQLDRIASLLENRTPALPDWFVEGMIGLYRRTTLRTDTIDVESAVWLSENESRALADDPDRPRALLPMHELLAARRAGADAIGPERAPFWRDQCTLFVRWAFAEDTGKRRDALWTFVDRLAHEPLSERLFHECFGLGFSDVRDRLSDYLPVAASGRLTLRASKSQDAPRLTLRDPTPAEKARIAGEWERLEISYVKRTMPEFTEKYIQQARQRLAQAGRGMALDAETLATRALIEIDAGNASAAIADLEAAVAQRVPRPRAYLELAHHRFAAFRAAASSARLTAAETDAVLQPLLVATEMEPPLLEVYRLIAQTLAASDRAPMPTELARLEAGAARFPRVAPLLFVAIQFSIAANRVDAAAALARLGLLHASESEHRMAFEAILARVAPSKS